MFSITVCLLLRKEKDNAESVSAMNRTPQSQNLRWAGHRGVRIHDGLRSQNPRWAAQCGVWICSDQDTVESEYVMSWTPQSQNPRWAGHCRVRIRDELNTAESESEMSWTPRSQNPWWVTKSESAMSRTPQSQNPRWAGHSGVRIHDELDTAESESTMSWTSRNQNPQWVLVGYAEFDCRKSCMPKS